MRYLILKRSFFSFIIILFAIFAFAPLAHAVTPTLAVSSTTSGDAVNVYVTGDPNSSVLLFYVKTGSGQQVSAIGSTNASGSLNTTLSASTYTVALNSSVYVTIGGVNGVQSPSVTWPTLSGVSNSNMVSLSQTGLVLSVGQSSVLTASNLGSSSLYLSGNTNPMIANVNISGNQVTVLANSYGSTVATVCLISSSSNCSSVYVTVQNSSVSPLSFSQNSISLYSGQTISIQINGGSGSYYVSNNSSQNQGTVQTSISGSSVNLTTSSTTGSASITVCSTDNTSCGIINVSIGSGGSTAVSFSQSSPTVTVGQSINVSIYGPMSSLFYVSSNSNPSIVQPNLSGSTLTLLGIVSGTSNISICVSSSNCGTLAVTVNTNGGTTNNEHPMLSQDSLSITVGQIRSITISGGSMPYRISPVSSNYVQSSLNSNVLTITGVRVGSEGMNVCSYSGSCSTISITVVGTSTPPTSTIPSGCISTTQFSPITGQYCPNYSLALPTIPSGCISTTQFSPVTGQYCPNYLVTSLATTPVNENTSSVTANTAYKFTKALKLGSKGGEVMELQKKLKELGYYKGKVDGGFGAILEKSVKAYQKAHKLDQLGNVGPGTRALLNKE